MVELEQGIGTRESEDKMEGQGTLCLLEREYIHRKGQERSCKVQF